MKRNIKDNNTNGTKDIFIDTAASLFANKGYHATGISEILKISKAPKGSLYYYFPEGKEQLADESLQKATLKILMEIDENFHVSAKPIECLQYHLRFIAKKIEKDMFRPNVSISLISLETFASNERLRLRCQEIFSKIQQQYEKYFVKKGIDESVAEFVAMTMVMLTEGAVILSLTNKSTKPLHNLADNLPKLFSFMDNK